jgi:hypothetical protein
MSVIFRNITRTIYDTTETTKYTATPTSDALTFDLTAAKAFYVGFNSPITTRYFHFSTLNTASVNLTVKYWDGDSWESPEDVVDQTDAFTKSGFISWTNESDWKLQALTPVTDKELFWIKFTVDGNLDAGTKLQSVLNLFCDDNLVKAYYPELISDTRYLPGSNTDYIEQYHAAKDLVCLRLKQDGIIKNEGQILDINEVSVAAVHAFVWILLNPIAVSDGDRERADKAYKDFNHELNKVKLDFDLDESGIIEQSEENQGHVFIKRL